MIVSRSPSLGSLTDPSSLRGVSAALPPEISSSPGRGISDGSLPPGALEIEGVIWHVILTAEGVAWAPPAEEVVGTGPPCPPAKPCFCQLGLKPQFLDLPFS